MKNPRKEFSQIYDQYVNKIYRFVFLKVNSREVAQDLTSETFLRAWKVFQDNQGQIENFSAFLYRIARNLVIDFYREKGRVKIVSMQNPIPDPKTNLEETVARELDWKDVKLALGQLKDNYQDVIVWRYLDELSFSEISQILDKSEAAVRVILHRALQVLRKELKRPT